MVNKIELAKMSQEALINYIEHLITRIERLEIDNQQLKLENQQLRLDNKQLKAENENYAMHWRDQKRSVCILCQYPK